ncbi:glycosyltransferase family 2 protein [Pseudaestuariivita atlantica]|uniref:Glycosyl transferase n=1 Tax=Pseudaestuariivita atlantica TaxID=1317121 RepID=A0A0L1JPL4_9RHOB|nr:glycosyltransferase [Pseudaestuariivita atlantica]KNG93343.1 hypothetical protein ATO11_12945 [Pseudaestuariivita atlantica]
MATLPASVVVVSRGRAGALTLCLTGLVQQDHPSFEIVVVADRPGLAALTAWEDRTGRTGQIKAVAFDEPNISVARNLGVEQAAGDVVAFIDDDAVPEPTWLRHLCAPFEESDTIHAAGGYVRGRNGISYQWRAQSVDRTGATVPIALDGDTPTALSPSPTQAIKVEGTNMAFRRATLAELGGFDPAYRYYLDETDLVMRLAARGGETAIVPLAEVHHGYLANATRNASRVPTDMTQIGASLAVFLRRHAPRHQIDAARARMRGDQRRRLLRHMVTGPLDPWGLQRILHSFDTGFEEGEARALETLPALPHAARPFQPIPRLADTPPLVLSGRSWQRGALMEQAARAVEEGRRVTVFCLSPTALYHRVRFVEPGIWLQTGGLFGRSDRDQPLFRVCGFASRVEKETRRISPQRGILA